MRYRVVRFLVHGPVFSAKKLNVEMYSSFLIASIIICILAPGFVGQGLDALKFFGNEILLRDY